MNSLLNLLRRIEESLFLFLGLESTMSQLRRSINELKLDLFEILSSDSWMKGLSENQRSLDWTNTTSFEDDEVVLNLSISNESSHRGNGLLGEIEVSGSIGWISTLSNSIDLLVHLSSMMVSHLTGSSNSPLDSRWMPRSDTSDLSKTSMSLSWELFASESLNDSAESFTFSGSEDINGLEVLKDLVDGDLFLEKRVTELDFILDGSSVNLDLIDISLLSLKVKSVWLSVTDESDNRAILDDFSSD